MDLDVFGLCVGWQHHFDMQFVDGLPPSTPFRVTRYNATFFVEEASSHIYENWDDTTYDCNYYYYCYYVNYKKYYVTNFFWEYYSIIEHQLMRFSMSSIEKWCEVSPVPYQLLSIRVIFISKSHFIINLKLNSRQFLLIEQYRRQLNSRIYFHILICE